MSREPARESAGDPAPWQAGEPDEAQLDAEIAELRLWRAGGLAPDEARDLTIGLAAALLDRYQIVSDERAAGLAGDLDEVIADLDSLLDGTARGGEDRAFALYLLATGPRSPRVRRTWTWR